MSEPRPVKDLDFTSGGAYAVYNWELFFHVPLTIAMHLSRNQLFAEAQQWFHYIFDPTDDSDGPRPTCRNHPPSPDAQLALLFRQ